MEHKIDVEKQIRERTAHLPLEYKTFLNYRIEGRDSSLEIDGIVLTPHAIYIIEIKNWSGNIEGNQDEWIVNGSPQRNPLITVQHKAKILKSMLVDYDQDFREFSVQFCLVFSPPYPNTDRLDSPLREFILKLDNLPDFIQNSGQLMHKGKEITKRHQTIFQHILFSEQKVSIPFTFSAPPLLYIDDFFNLIESQIKAIDFIYSILALASYSSASNLNKLCDIIEKNDGASNFQLQELNSFLENSQLESLRLQSVHYGSPVTFDLLGIGNILEITRQIIKDVSWRAKHEKDMAEREKRKKKLELEKEKIEIASQELALEKAKIEIILQEIELIKNLPLSKKQKKEFISALTPKLLLFTNSQTTLLLESELESPKNAV